MPVSTLLVCDEPTKSEQLQALISTNPLLNFTGAVDSESAGQQILQMSPSVVWIELAPEPAKALSLLGALKETYPAIQYLVSYDTLKADLVKSAMQLGAVEYIDPDSMERLLPDAIKRIQHNLNVAVLGTPRPAHGGASTATPNPLLSPGPDPSYVPGAGASRRSVDSMRSKSTELEGAPGALPNWLLPSITLFMLLLVILVAIILRTH